MSKTNTPDSFKDNSLCVEWPDQVGHWWFYGYRYGRYSIAEKVDPELIFCEVVAIANGLIVKGDGQIIYKSEVENPHFIPATLPELIDL